MEMNSRLKVQIKTLSYVNMTQLNPFLDPQSQPDLLEPKNWAQNWVEPNGSGLAALHWAFATKVFICSSFVKPAA